MAEKDEKTTRTSVGVGNTEINRETKSSESQDSYRDRDRYDRYDRDRYDRDDEDDYQGTRRGSREVSVTLRDTGRNLQRQGTNILTAGCDLIGGFFVDIGEAIRGGAGSSGSASSCGPVDSCAGTQDDSQSRPPRRTTASRTEIRRTTSR